MKKGQHIIGGVQLKSDLSILELGDLISREILGGLPLEGIEKNIYEEVPAIFNEVLGLTVVLQGYSGIDHEWGYVFNVTPQFSSDDIHKETIDLSNYLTSLFKSRLKDFSEILIIEINE